MAQTVFETRADFTSVTSVSTTGRTSTTGSFFLIGVAWNNYTTCNGVSDNKGNTYTSRGNAQFASTVQVQWWTCENGNGGAGHTASTGFANNTDGALYFIEIPGSATSGAWDTGAEATSVAGTTSPFAITSGTPAQADYVAVSLVTPTSGSTGITASGYTVDVGTSATSSAIAYNIVTGNASAQSISWAITSTSNAARIIGLVKAAAGGGGGAAPIPPELALRGVEPLGARTGRGGRIMRWMVQAAPIPPPVVAGSTTVTSAGAAQAAAQAAGGVVLTLSALAQAAAQAAGSVVVTAASSAQAASQAIGGSVVVVAGNAQAASQGAGVGQAVISASGAGQAASQAEGAVVSVNAGQAQAASQAVGGFVVVGAGAAQAAAQASAGAVVSAGGAAQSTSQAIGIQAGSVVVAAGVSASGAQAGGGAVVASSGFAGSASQAIAQAVQVVTGRAYSSSQAGGGVSTSAAGASSSASQAAGQFPNVIAMAGVSASYAQAAGALPGATVPFVFEMEFEAGGASRAPRRKLLEVKVEPVLQRMLAKKLQRVRPAGDRAAKRARRIELEAATLVLNGATEREVRGKLLEWEAQRPYIPPVLEEIPPLDVFMSQVGFRIEQAQAMLDAQRARQQDEDALIAIVLALQAGI